MSRVYFILFFITSINFSCRKEKITWITREVNSGTSYPLHDVFFLNDSIGFVCGGSRYSIGIFSRSRDGGKTWSRADSIFGKCAYTNFFFDEREGFVAGYDSWLAYTQDTGKTFSANTGDYAPVNDIAFFDRNKGVKVGGNGYASGQIAYTSNGGIDWSTGYFPNNFRAVCYADSHTVFASGYGVIYRSTDAGEHFFPLNISGDFFVAMDFPSSHVGYFAGYEGMILKTSDAGNSFTKVRAGNAPFAHREYFEGIDFWDENNGFVVGDGGSVLGTTDGGNSWKKVNSFTAANLRDIHLFSATSGIIVGDEGKIFLFKQ